MVRQRAAEAAAAARRRRQTVEMAARWCWLRRDGQDYKAGWFTHIGSARLNAIKQYRRITVCRGTAVCGCIIVYLYCGLVLESVQLVSSLVNHTMLFFFVLLLFASLVERTWWYIPELSHTLEYTSVTVKYKQLHSPDRYDL